MNSSLLQEGSRTTSRCCCPLWLNTQTESVCWRCARVFERVCLWGRSSLLICPPESSTCGATGEGPSTRHTLFGLTSIHVHLLLFRSSSVLCWCLSGSKRAARAVSYWSWYTNRRRLSASHVSVFRHFSGSVTRWCCRMVCSAWGF